MKRIYYKIPTTRVLEGHVARLSKEMGVKPPKINLWSQGDGRYDPIGETLNIPAQEWSAYYQPDINSQTWWGVVLHEFAHHLNSVWNGEGGHGSSFYSILTGLVFREGLSLRYTLADEEWIYPQASRKGWKATGASLLKRKGR